MPVTFEPIIEGREGWGSMQISGRAFVAEGTASASAPDMDEDAQGGQWAGGQLVECRLWEKKMFQIAINECGREVMGGED